MERFLLFLAFVIPQIVFSFALLFGVAAILRREEAAAKKRRAESLQTPLEERSSVEVSEEIAARPAVN